MVTGVYSVLTIAQDSKLVSWLVLGVLRSDKRSWSPWDEHEEREGQRERERETDRQIDRQTQKETERQTDTQRDTERWKQRERM